MLQRITYMTKHQDNIWAKSVMSDDIMSAKLRTEIDRLAMGSRPYSPYASRHYRRALCSQRQIQVSVAGSFLNDSDISACSHIPIRLNWKHLLCYDYLYYDRWLPKFVGKPLPCLHVYSPKIRVADSSKTLETIS